MKLTARERLIKTLNHQDPGRVVMDMGSTSITGMNVEAVTHLRAALGLEKYPVKIDEPMQMLGMIDDDLRAAVGVDVVGINNDMTIFGFKNEGYKPWKVPTGIEVMVPEKFNTTTDAQGNTFIYPNGDTGVAPAGKAPAGGYFFDNTHKDMSDFDEDNDARLDFKDDFGVFTDEHLRTIQDKCEYYYNNTEYGMIAGGALAGLGDLAILPGPFLKNPKGLRDAEEFMVAHYTMPDYVKEMFAMHTEAAMANVKLLKQALGEKIQAIIVSSTDFGTQKAPFISNDFYREFYKPNHKKINDWIHENTDWKVFFHTCGAIAPLLPEFYEAGVDILNPVQTSAEGMDAKMLKEKWGGKFVFWGGGVDTQHVLPFGTPEMVYEEVSKTLELFAPGGGYVFVPIHNVQGPTPAENLVAMYKAVDDYRNRA